MDIFQVYFLFAFYFSFGGGGEWGLDNGFETKENLSICDMCTFTSRAGVLRAARFFFF